MANEAGVVKSVTGGSVRALNNATGEVRNLSVGDIVYQNEKIITDSADSKVTITQTDGKDITLIGKDTLTLDQDSNNNETVADISALQQAILKGTDLNALEETAAGGPQAGGNGGDGVSLSSTSFAEGGHISNISANVGSIDALSLAAGGDNSFGVSGGSAVGDAEVTPIVPPIATIKALGSTGTIEGYDWQSGPEYRFSLGDIDANGVNNLAARPTTYTFSLSGVEKGIDYDECQTPDGNYIFEYKDANGDWVPMYDNKLTVNDPRDIENLEVRIAAPVNNSVQNQGERVGDDPMFSGIDGAVQGVYERKATVTVSSNNPQIASSSNTATITETDDNISFTKGLDGKRIMTFIGDDTINLYGDIKNGSRIESGNDNDVINLYGNLTTGSVINTGNENIWSEVKRDIVNVKSGASVNGAILASEGVATFNIEKGATLNNAHINHFNRSDQTVNVEGTLNETEMSLGTGNNKITLDGATSTNKLRVETHSGNDDVVIKNSKILGDEDLIGNHNVMNLRSGKNTVTVENSEISRMDIQANGNRPSDKTTVTLNATKGEKFNINGQGEEDVFTLKGGSTLNSSGVILGNGKNTIDIDGAKITKSAFITGSDNDTINLKKATIDGSTIDGGAGNDTISMTNGTKVTNSKILMGDGVDRVYIEDEVTLDGTINTGADDDEVNIKGNITATTQANIITGAGTDTINIASGVTLTHTVIEMGAGEDTIEISGRDRSESSTDRITFKGSTLYTDDSGYTANDIDHVTISNTTFMKSDDGRLSALNTGGGDDIIKINDGTVFQDTSYIVAGTGADKIYLNSGSTFNYSRVYGDYADGNINGGNDEIYVNGAVFNAKNGHGGIHAGGGDDKIFLNSGKFNNAYIEGDAGNDTIEIKKETTLNNATINGGAGDDTIVIGKGANTSSATINGGAGKDTLVVNDDTIDFSKVSGIEKIQLGGHTDKDGNIVNDNATLNLTANDVQNILRGSNESMLRIDGDGNDKLNLSGFDRNTSTPSPEVGYTEYTSTDGTVKIEIKNEVQLDF